MLNLSSVAIHAFYHNSAELAVPRLEKSRYRVGFRILLGQAYWSSWVFRLCRTLSFRYLRVSSFGSHFRIFISVLRVSGSSVFESGGVRACLILFRPGWNGWNGARLLVVVRSVPSCLCPFRTSRPPSNRPEQKIAQPTFAAGPRSSTRRQGPSRGQRVS